MKFFIEVVFVVVVFMVKCGRKGVVKGGGFIRGGVVRGCGCGWGVRCSGRVVVRIDKVVKVKKGKVNEEIDGNEDVIFMEGFEIIDEIGDGED